MFGPCKWSACPSRVRTVVWTRCWEHIPFSCIFFIRATLSMAYARYNHISLWLYSRSPQGGPPNGLSPDLTVQGAHIWEYLLWIMLKWATLPICQISFASICNKTWCWWVEPLSPNCILVGSTIALSKRTKCLGHAINQIALPVFEQLYKQDVENTYYLSLCGVTLSMAYAR